MSPQTRLKTHISAYTMQIAFFDRDKVYLTADFSLPEASDFSNQDIASLPPDKTIATDNCGMTASAADPPPCAKSIAAIGVRESRTQMDPTLFGNICRAKQILYWHTHSLHCPVCGAKTERTGEIEKTCHQCGFRIYPPLAPAVIVLVRRKTADGSDEALLVRALNFRGDHFGLVAGFVEPGESLEEAVARELAEEVGLRVTNIKYFGSQPWPFPCGIMIGFTADYLSGKIKLQESELAAADFFKRDNLPTLPDGMSIARKLIDAWRDGTL